MALRQEILDKLKCNECECFLSCGPVYSNEVTGKAVCGRCTLFGVKGAVRNYLYEALAQAHVFPCRYKELGCPDRVDFSLFVPPTHESICQYRRYDCPTTKCSWTGARILILQHFHEKHPDHIVGNMCNLIHQIKITNQDALLLIAFEYIFLLHIKICLPTKKIYHTLQYLGECSKMLNVKYTLNIRKGGFTITKPGVITSLNIGAHDDTTIATTFNSIEEILGGIEGARFNFTVEIKCSKCKKFTIYPVCRNDQGWLCENCGPYNRYCSFGCLHADINKKCRKHEIYFCPYRTKCKICDDYYEYIEEDSILQHYTEYHVDMIHQAGTTYEFGKTELSWHYFLLASNNVGTGICTYTFNDYRFCLGISTVLKSNEMHKYRCCITLINPFTTFKRSYFPNISYNYSNDWYIELTDNRFLMNDEISISIDIKRNT